jgi:hypothetical protein
MIISPCVDFYKGLQLHMHASSFSVSAAAAVVACRQSLTTACRNFNALKVLVRLTRALRHQCLFLYLVVISVMDVFQALSL